VALNLSQLLAHKQRLSYLIFPILPRGSRMIIGAPAKHKKSLLAMNLAYALAEGGDFLGWEVKEPQSVLYVEQEIGTPGTKARMERIHSAKGGIVAAENLHFLTKGRVRYSLDEGSPGLAALRGEIERLKPQVIVIDPLRRFTFHDEDSSTEMVKVFKTLDELQEDFGLTQIIVHHTGKRNEFRDGTDPESLRGSSFIFDDGDSYMMISQPVKRDGDFVRLHFRFRHSADIEPMDAKFDQASNTFERKR